MTCDDCGQSFAITWWASAELWREVNGPDERVLCPSCFVTKAATLGKTVTFTAAVPGEREPAAWEAAEREYQRARSAEAEAERLRAELSAPTRHDALR